MAFLQWRRFNFFDKEIVKDSGQPLDKLKELNLTCSTSGRGLIVFGDAEGNIHFLSRQFQLTAFKAFEISVQYIEQLKQNAVLVSVGFDDPGINPVFKIWNVEKNDQSGKPLCIRVFRSPLSIPSVITAFTVYENLSLMALGFEDSSILLFRGDITRERQSKTKMLKANIGPITSLVFRMMDKQTLLFTATTDEVYVFLLLPKSKEEKIVLDNHGCNPKCSVLSDAKQHNQFVIGRPEAVYFYQHDGRGPCLVFEGEKNILHWFKSYLIVVGKDDKAIQQSAAHAERALKLI